MSALNEQNAKVILGVHTFYVKLGVKGSEGALIETLKKYPSREIAEEFLNCGNPALKKPRRHGSTNSTRDSGISPGDSYPVGQRTGSAARTEATEQKPTEQKPPEQKQSNSAH